MFDQLQQMLRERLGLIVPANDMQRQSTNMNSWSPRQNVNPQFQQSYGTEGTAIQGNQYDDRVNPQAVRQPELQNAIQGYRIQNANPQLRIKR